MKHIYKNSSNTNNYQNAVFLQPTAKELKKLFKKTYPKMKGYQLKYYFTKLNTISKKYYYLLYIGE